MNIPLSRISAVATAWNEERRVLEIRIADLRTKLAYAEHDKAMLLADCERLRRELDDANGVIR